MENILYYSDLLKRKKSLGWKRNGKIKSRDDINKYVYEDLINNLYRDEFKDEFKKIRIAIAGPSNEELEYIKKILKKETEIYVFEPDKTRYEELKSFFGYEKNIRIINDYIYNVKNYNELEIDFAILLNVINWRPTYPLKLLKGLYNKLSKRGIITLSLYTEIFPNSKDKKYIVKTPSNLKEILEKNSIRKFNELYSDSNGILKVYVLNKTKLGNVVKNIKNRVEELKEEIEFYSILPII